MSTSRTQTFVSFFIIILLILIAVAIGVKQQFYAKIVSEDTALSDSLFGGEYSAAGDVENYDSGNLYEKIDGKADLYLNNGFISLQCRRFADKSKKDLWAEIYLYDMANGENAFAVYSLQKRSESEPLGWAQFGYSTSDSLFAAAGKYYMEIYLSSDNASLSTSSEAAVKNLILSMSQGKIEIPFLNLFPAENLVADSFKFINADAFGCSDLKNIFAAEYKINGSSITAYLSKDNVGETFKKYHRFLMDNGGKESQNNLGISDCKAVELFGTTDIFFKAGDFFVGVRGSAPSGDLNTIANEFIKKFKPKNDKR